MKFGPVLHFLGRLTAMVASSMLVPFVCALVFREFQAAGAFLVSAMLTGVVGFGMIFAFRRDSSDLYRSEGILIVVGGWFLASLFGALPYLLTGTPLRR